MPWTGSDGPWILLPRNREKDPCDEQPLSIALREISGRLLDVDTPS
ncbi:MAG: hypothetical protein ACRDOH_14340 [Streptosporangiaceae bacterium]